MRIDFTAALSNRQHDAIVHQHGAFDYTSERYGFEAVRLSGITGASTNSTTNLLVSVQANNTKYLTGDDLLDTSALEMITEETDTQLLFSVPSGESLQGYSNPPHASTS